MQRSQGISTRFKGKDHMAPSKRASPYALSLAAHGEYAAAVDCWLEMRDSSKVHSLFLLSFELLKARGSLPEKMCRFGPLL